VHAIHTAQHIGILRADFLTIDLLYAAFSAGHLYWKIGSFRVCPLQSDEFCDVEDDWI